MSRALTIEQIVRDYPDLVPGQTYVNNAEKLQWKCLAGLKHPDYPQSYKNHSHGNRCPVCACRAPITIEEIASKYPDLVAGQTYVNNEEKLQWECLAGLKHPNYLQRRSRHSSGQVCPICSYIKRGLAKRFTIEEIAANYPEELVPGQKYVNSKKKLLWRCLAGLGHPDYPQSYAHHSREISCPKCKGVTIHNLLKLTIKEIGARYPGELVPGQKYVNSKTRICWRCLAGLNHPDYSQTYSSHSAGQSCPTCSESKGSKRIRLLGGLLFEREKRFDTCRNSNPLPFDFKVRRRKILIEYHGGQHYRPVGWLGGKKAFKGVQHRDGIKRRWARKNGYVLIVIPHTVVNIEDVLVRRLAKHKVSIPLQKAA
jgi:hypothetical protein